MVRPRNVNRSKVESKKADWEQEEFDSRTQIKEAALAVTELGEQLLQMSPATLSKLNLPGDLREALDTMSRITKGNAIKRQKSYIGKLLRQNEPLIVEIKALLDEEEIKRKQQNAHFHKLEQWRDRLVEEGDEALGELMQQYPQVDRQHLRQAIRNAQKEQEQGKPPKAAREIFKYLRSLEW
ncbi:ribosome biogenesis factor YjgA [Thiomicrorhabdus xiamenensis]|uniref:Dual-action ribosomal maturation protein DarP n=1 Tax=Thiomicrorhabdus xiamenensis TaxID=2739063 RepID=A0A7D4TAK0_9GAMM|nr:ribosome biogenesis factor YjgA [Thiomicrorhabdus xiamenensis]QKI89166.1 DUF615 domain-containing protein [Thiomicrorhabdus xiamenensis]